MGGYAACLSKIFFEPSSMVIFEAAVEVVLALSRSKESFCSVFEAEEVVKQLMDMWPAGSLNALSSALGLLSNLANFAT